MNKKFVPPAVQSIEALRIVYVVDKYATVRAPVEGNPQRLEALLASSVPELRRLY